jgi:hypothetical protein
MSASKEPFMATQTGMNWRKSEMIKSSGQNNNGTNHHELIRVAAATLIGLQIWEACTGTGPLGGSPITETGIVFGSSFVLAETLGPINEFLHLCKRGLRKFKGRTKKHRRAEKGDVIDGLSENQP